MRLNEVRAMSFRSCTTTTQPPDESPRVRSG
jgi:hypothetical protein